MAGISGQLGWHPDGTRRLGTGSIGCEPDQVFIGTKRARRRGKWRRPGRRASIVTFSSIQGFISGRAEADIGLTAPRKGAVRIIRNPQGECAMALSASCVNSGQSRYMTPMADATMPTKRRQKTDRADPAAGSRADSQVAYGSCYFLALRWKACRSSSTRHRRLVIGTGRLL